MNRKSKVMTAAPITDSAGQIAPQDILGDDSFQSLFEHAGEGIFQSTVDGRYLRVNPALAAMYGFDSPSNMMSNLTDISKSLYVDPTSLSIVSSSLARLLVLSRKFTDATARLYGLAKRRVV